MKNYKAIIISALLLMVNNYISAITAATSVNIDGGSYTLYEDGTAKIQGISKAVASFTIPHTVTYNDEPFTVTCIGKDAFWRKMQKLVIPNTIELAEVLSLRCDLDSLIIEDGNTKLLSNSENDPEWWGTFKGTNYAFGGHYKYVYYGREIPYFDLGSLVFDVLYYELVQAKYTTIDKIDIGPLVTIGCEVNVPDVNILSSEYALKNIDLSNCKTLNINRNIINSTNTSSITNLTIGQHVNSLPNNFIGGMPNLMIVKIAKDATGFNPAELSASTSLYALDVEDGNSLCIFEDGFLYNPQKSTLFLYMSNYAPASLEFTLPATLTEINDNAFHDAWVTRIEAPSLENIGARAFYNSHLNELITNSKIKSIGKEAFSGTEIGSLKLGDNITEISDRAFYDCENLKIDDEVFP
ncbi:MAG: leucine-rich repeat domain-containing protein, partial [Muribaculaceae bacterium]|nr:leucine-rich repeat domain-containing protein [Muribaculaceae bacterium]